MSKQDTFASHEWDAISELPLHLLKFLAILSPGQADGYLRIFVGARTKQGADAFGNDLLSEVLTSISDKKIASYGQAFTSLEKARKGKLDYLRHFEIGIRVIRDLIDKRLSPSEAHDFKRAVMMFAGSLAAASGSGNDLGIDQNESRVLTAIKTWLTD